jgi:hypothetical protein
MNTTITFPSYLLTREQFQAFRTYFRTRAKDRRLSPTDILTYNMIRGLPLDRGFSPVTSPIKIANGAQPWMSFEQAKATLRWSIKRYPADFKKTFGDIITDEQVATLTALLQ